MAEKSYQDLKSEVWEKDLCAGCGACVAICPADVIIFSESGTATISGEYRIL